MRSQASRSDSVPHLFPVTVTCPVRPALRYTLSIGVGSVITLQFAATDHLVALSLLPLYGTVTSMILAHNQRWRHLSRGDPDWSASKRGATVAGVGAFAGSLLLQSSVPAGVAGYRLMLLGMTGGIAEIDER